MVCYAFYQFEFGYLKLGYTETAVVYLKRADRVDEVDIRSSVSDLAYAQIREYLDGKRKAFDFPCEFHGTKFQCRAWRALCDIPYGETRTYSEIAVEVGSPKACRAVGAANHDNPIWIAVPCHRVIGAGGKLTGYAGGLEMKRMLLDLERAHKNE